MLKEQLEEKSKEHIIEKIKKSKIAGPFEIKRLTNNDIRELKLNRIISTSNFDKEFFFEKDYLKDIPFNWLKDIYNLINETQNNSHSTIYFKVACEDYKLYKFEP